MTSDHPEQAPPGPEAGGATRDQQAGDGGDEPADLADGVDEQHPGAQPPPLQLRREAHVASPSTAAVTVVSSCTSRCAVASSSPLMCSGPAAEAVVTVTLVSPNSCSSGPRWESTVWIREIGAIRRSWVEPAGLGVDRHRADLPAVHPVAPARHHGEVTGGDQHGDQQGDDAQAAVAVVQPEPRHLAHEQDEPAVGRAHGPVGHRPAADQVGRRAQQPARAPYARPVGDMAMAPPCHGSRGVRADSADAGARC